MSRLTKTLIGRPHPNSKAKVLLLTLVYAFELWGGSDRSSPCGPVAGPLPSSAPGAPTSAPRGGDGEGGGDTPFGVPGSEALPARWVLRCAAGDAELQSANWRGRVCSAPVSRVDCALLRGAVAYMRSRRQPVRSAGRGCRPKAGALTAEPGDPPAFRKPGGGRARRRVWRRLVAAPSSGGLLTKRPSD